MNSKKVNRSNASHRSTQVSPRKRKNVLGTEVAKHRGRSSSCGGTAILIFAGLAALIPFIYSFWLVDFAYTQYGVIAANTWGRSWLVISALSAACFLLLAFYRLYLFQRCVAVFTNGIRIRLGFLVTHSYTWQEIQGISNGIMQERFLHLPIRTYHKAVLVPNKGKPMVLRAPLENIPVLVQLIKRNLYSQLMPRERSRFQAGDLVDFGPLTIDKGSLQFKPNKKGQDKPIPWTSIHSIDVQAGFLCIQLATEQRIRIPVSNIVNFEIFMEIIQQEVKV